MDVPTFPYRCYALISRRQIAANYHSVRAAIGPQATVLGVVKANAYGHGAAEVSRVLVSEGAKWLAVSTVEEGVALRQAGLAVNILVMTGFLRYEWEALVEHALTPVIHSLEDLAALGALAHAASKSINYHLKIDSGMHRLGTRADVAEILAAIQSARHANLTGLMTHLASAADYTTQQTDQQAAQFARIWEALRAGGVHPTYVHMSATNAIAYGRNAPWLTMARPGHALYGYVSPARGNAPSPILSVQPALTWRAKILAVKEIPEGALVGYGGAFRAPHSRRIAVVAAGYADAVPHRLSNRGKVIVAGKLAPILGTVSMDLTTIDISHAPELRPGDDVTLLGREGEASQDAQLMARQAGTISYSILCGIAGRVERVYV
jgi:alanine racemase